MKRSSSDKNTAEMARKAALDLLEYCRSNNWAGYDPYDGLTSPLFERLSFLQNRPARLAFIQFMKRSDINFRRIAGVSPGQNPKALALFSSSLIKLFNLGLIREPGIVLSVLDQLIRKRTPDQSYAGWGYNFDWQTRTVLVPKYTPNIVCTTFAGNALLDAYKTFGDRSYLEIATSAGDFVLNGLTITERRNGICFSYTPLDTAIVHNANLLGASFLARLSSATGNREFLDHAHRAARYSAGCQLPDGSWPYGENQTQKWIDNFHTGYNLTALHDFSRYTGSEEFEKHVEKGFAFYRSNFFEEGRLAKYYHNRLYPIDVHSVAQSIITLTGLKTLDPDSVDLALSVCRWALDNMRSSEGFFYYQKKRFSTNRISYMRWSQAWMLLALAVLLEHAGGTTKPAANHRAAVAATAKPDANGPKSGPQTGERTTPAYVLITPARNESAFIALTIESMIRQTVLPLKWVIVSDGSTDGTDEIVNKYAAEHSWMQLVRMPERSERHFAGKVHAFNAGREKIKDLRYDFIGNLDADISFDPDYFSFLLDKFAEDPSLGVGGTPFREGSRQYDYRFTSIEHVSGACQLFRRQCFETIGGYRPLRKGGVDHVAVLTARMKGWKTRTFTGKTCEHHRSMGTAKNGRLVLAFKGGQVDYILGSHPLWQIFRCAYQMKNKPYMIAGALRLTGFFWAALKRMKKDVPPELVAFRRKEQMQRLAAFFRKIFPFTGTDAFTRPGVK